MLRVSLFAAALVSCNDPDGKLRIRLEGSLFEPDGTETEFKGGGRDRENDLDSTPWVDFAGAKTDSGAKWEFTFQPEHGALRGRVEGEVIQMGDQRLLERGAWDGSGWTVPDVETLNASTDKGRLGLQYIMDKRLGETVLEDTMGYRVDVVDATASKFDGTLVARFENGVLFEGEIQVRGALQPGIYKDDDDTDSVGTGGGACANFSDSTSYYGDMQLDSLCWAAGSYEACGNQDGVDATCASLQGMEECCFTGSGSCPYC